MALTLHQAKSIDAAEKYFAESLSVGDYYMGEAISGTLHGKGTEILGLEEGSVVTSEDFGQLLRRIHPQTGEHLAQRKSKNPRPCLDVTLSPPKSVTALWAVNKDGQILDALREAVHETMKYDVETLATRRVRTGEHAWSQQQKQTGNILYSAFLHRTSREVDNTVDPHLHYHCIVFNHTTDGEKHYALEPETIFRQRYSLQSKFEARLARKLKYDLGYEVEHVEYKQSGKIKSGWEVKGVSRKVIEKFSRRTAEIEAYAEEHGVTDAKEKEKLSTKTRKSKEATAGIDELRSEWRSRLTPEELAAFEQLRSRTLNACSSEEELQLANVAVQYALDHHLHRESTVEKHTLIGTASKKALFLTPEQIEAELTGGEIIEGSMDVRGVKRQLITTLEILQAEEEMIAFAKEGRGTRQTLAQTEHRFTQLWLSDEQQAAVRYLLNECTDTVMLFEGAAGTGKSSTLEEVRAGVRNSGKKMYGFAPTTGAVDVLREKNFEGAQTLQHLIHNKRLQEELREQVILVDEAALIDVKTMVSLFKIVKEQNARLILAGDVKQHGAIARGESLRILQEHAGLRATRLEQIHRQQGAYKRAVELISLGTEVIDERTGLTGIVAGFDKLDRLGKVIEIVGDERHAILTQQYLENRTKKSVPLVVAPTHAEGRELTTRIRERLSEEGALGKTAEFAIMRSLNLTTAEKSQTSVYKHEGLMVQFQQNCPGFKKGERYQAKLDHSGNPILKPLNGGASKPVPLKHADRFEVYERDRIEFAVGDKIRFSLSGKAIDGKGRISNGRVDEVKGFDRQGNIRLKGGMVVSRDYAHWDHAYVITSHASQGKQSKVAITAIGSQSLPAVSARQLYVSTSRGSDDCVIYVQDKEAVRRAIQDAGEQLSATELVHGQAAKARELKAECSAHRRMVMERGRDWWRKTFRGQGVGKSPKISPQGMANPPQHPSPQLGRG